MSVPNSIKIQEGRDFFVDLVWNDPEVTMQSCLTVKKIKPVMFKLVIVKLHLLRPTFINTLVPVLLTSLNWYGWEVIIIIHYLNIL